MYIRRHIPKSHVLFGLLLVAIFLGNILGQGAVDEAVRKPMAPVIQPPVYNLDIPMAQTLELTCNGKRPLDWKVPFENVRVGGRYKIENVELPPGNFQSKLTMPNTEYTDTGRYLCHYANVPLSPTENGDSDDVNFINVFVNDQRHLFVPHPNGGIDGAPSFYTLTENEPIVIPCLPTYSSANVQLLNDNRQTVHKAEDVKFEPSVGFTIFYPNAFFSGGFMCRYEVNLGGAPKVQEEHLHFFYNAASDDAPRPTIDISAAKHVVAGKSFALTCNATSSADTLVDLSWVFPRPATKSRAVVDELKMDTIKTELYTYRRFRSRVTVNDVDQTLDNGEYSCVSTLLHSRKTNRATVSIKPFSAGVESHIELRPVKEIYDVLKGKSVLLEAAYNAYPKPDFRWKRNGRNVKLGERVFENTHENATVLRIIATTGDDAGVYTVEASAGTGKAAINITLFVNEAPTAELTSNESRPFFAMDGRVDFECSVTAYPTANISWSFQPCQRSCLESDLKMCGPWTDIAREKISTRVDQSERKVHSKYPSFIKENGSGFLRCRASNFFAGRDHHTTQTQRILVTDVDGGFHTKMLPEKPVEKQEVLMMCAANNYEYSEVSWEWRSSDRGDFMPVQRGNQYFHLIEDNKSIYSHNVTLMIPSATSRLNGQYRCVATKRSVSGSASPRFSLPINLKLLDAIPPVFASHVETDQNAKEIDYQDTLRLDCSATGAPQPSYQWSKGEVLVEQIGAIRFEEKGAILINEKITQDDSGYYLCNASNSKGFVTKQWKVNVHGESVAEKQRRWVIVAASVGTVIVIFVPILIFVCFRLKKEKERRVELEYLKRMLSNDTANTALIDPTVPLTDQVALLPYDEKWEVPRERLKLFNKVLGTGQFGRVLKGEATDLFGEEGRTIVAVKMLKETADLVQRKALLGEIKIMAHIGRHLNVVNLMGAVTKSMVNGELYMLTEFCRHGSLRDYLQTHQGNRFFNQVDVITGKLLPLSDEQEDTLAKTRQELLKTEQKWDGHIVTTRDLISYSFQISNGMTYLISKNVIHRDLAARNVLVAEDNVVKICDFGLAKQQYQYTRTNQAELPIKWMAIESIYESVFSKESDVWSFGVLLWELFTLGSTPYPGVNVDSDFVERIRNGYRMERPYLAPKEIYEIMRHCWESVPKSRPDFSALKIQLGDLLDHSVRKKYLDLNAPYELYNVENTTDYVNDPMKRSSQIDGSNQYLNSYRLTPATAPRPVTPVKPKRSVRSNGNQNAHDSMELQPFLRQNESALNPSRPGNLIENEEYLNDNFIKVPVNLSLQKNGLPPVDEVDFHTDRSLGGSGDARTNYLYSAAAAPRGGPLTFSSDV